MSNTEDSFTSRPTPTCLATMH